MDCLILKRDGQTIRVARRTIDLPGRQVVRDWVMVSVDPVYGAPDYTTDPRTILAALHTRQEVERHLMNIGYTIVGVLKI
jgi:hypothetical protein